MSWTRQASYEAVNGTIEFGGLRALEWYRYCCKVVTTADSGGCPIIACGAEVNTDVY